MDILIGKTGATVALDESRLSDETKAFLFAYGVKQWLNDKHASVQIGKEGATGETVMGVVADAIEKLYTGDLRMSAGRTNDPVAREAKAISMNEIKASVSKLSRETLVAAFAKRGWASGKDEFGASKMRLIKELAEAHLAKNNERIIRAARDRVAENAANVADVDLGA